MVAEAEVVCQQNVGVLDVKHFPNKVSDVHEIGDADANSPPSFDRVRATESVSAELLTSQEVSFLKTPFFVDVISAKSLVPEFHIMMPILLDEDYLNGCIGSYFCFNFQKNLFIIVGSNLHYK